MKRYLVQTALWAMLAALLASCPARAAEPSPWDLGEMVVSARGAPSRVSDTPGGVGVATARDIELAPKASIADALATIPGLTPAGDSAWGRDISIRGLGGTSVVVLVDGLRVNTATDLNARFGIINPLDVQRVEVLKGPLSSLYGSGSIGGVVNIITRKGRFSQKESLHGRFSLGGASNPAGLDAYGNLRYDSPSLWLLASMAGRDHGDTKAGDGDSIPNSQFRDQQARLAGQAKIGERLTLGFQVLQTEGHNIGIPGGPSTMPAAARVTYPRISNTLASLEAELDLDLGMLKRVSASFYMHRNQRRVRVDRIGVAAVREIRPGADHQTYGGRLQADLKSTGHSVVVGAEAWTWHLDSWRKRYMANGSVLQGFPVPESRQTSLGLFCEDDWKLSDRLVLNLGARLDRMRTSNHTNETYTAGSQYDTGWNLHLGLTWRAGAGWSHTLLLASSYRAADMLERFKLIDLGGGQQLRGDPELKPEVSVFMEYGLHYQAGAWWADLRLFANSIHDYISLKRQSPDLLVLHNVGQARIYGAELEGRWRCSRDWTLFANLTALEGRDESVDQYLPDIAPVSGRAGVVWHRGNWWGRLETAWALDQNHTPPDVPAVDGYTTLNAALIYKLTAWGLDHRLSLTLDNLLDAHYRNYLANSRGIDLYEPGFCAALAYTLEF